MHAGAVAAVLSWLLVLGLAAPALATYPGRNGRIFFSAPSRGEATGCGVASLSADATGYECLSYFPYDPAVAPDQRHIVAVEGSDTTDVFAMGIDGAGARRLTRAAAGTHNYSPSYSRDSRQILWFTFGTAHDGVYTMNADGSGQHQLTDGGQDPVFSPSGAQIAYGGQGIGIANADGSGSRLVVPNTSSRTVSGLSLVSQRQLNGEPSWFPDGRQIAFSRRTTVQSADCSVPPACKEHLTDEIDVWAMNADGSGQRRLTSTAGVDEEDPFVSPDGTKIAYFRVPHGHEVIEGQIWVMNADGTGQHVIAHGANPEWSTMQRSPGRPRLQFSFRRTGRRSGCLGQFDGYAFAVHTNASHKTLFDISVYVDGRLVDQVFSTTGFGEGADQVRRGRHRVRVVVEDPAIGDRISRTFRFTRC